MKCTWDVMAIGKFMMLHLFLFHKKKSRRLTKWQFPDESNFQQVAKCWCQCLSLNLNFKLHGANFTF